MRYKFDLKRFPKKKSIFNMSSKMVHLYVEILIWNCLSTKLLVGLKDLKNKDFNRFFKSLILLKLYGKLKVCIVA